jgi:CHAD domain-containing protein
MEPRSCHATDWTSLTVTIALPTTIPVKRVGLEVWMNHVLELADKVQDDWSTDNVHDLRVALRRCRTMADALSEVNPASSWKKLKKVTRDLFQALGELRDTQVAKQWVKKFGQAKDPVRGRLLRVLGKQEQEQRKKAEKALHQFDRKSWKKWSRKFPAKAEFFPLESVVFQRLALAELNKAVNLYHRARKVRSGAAWHWLRIGLKGFRYILENFLPQRYTQWSKELKSMQDMLGEVHDLDVLRLRIRKQATGLNPETVAKWMEEIEKARKTRLEEFRAKTANKDSSWVVWHKGLEWGHNLKTVSPLELQRVYSAS